MKMWHSKILKTLALISLLSYETCMAVGKVTAGITPSVVALAIEENLKRLDIVLPVAPAAVGNYVPYVISGNLVYINQIALSDGKIRYPGIIGRTLTEKQAQEETRQAVLNILSVLKRATHGDLDRVKQVVQLTGFFNAQEGYQDHAKLMNTASDLIVDIFGPRGVHTRATVGAKSLPLDSSVEIQAIFELYP